MRRGYTLPHLLLGLAAVVIIATGIVFTTNQLGTKNENATQSAITNAVVNTNSAANVNAGIRAHSLLALATGGDGNSKRILKIDPTTGSVVKETTLTPELAFGGGRFSGFNASNSVQFGADGDSVIFYQGNSSDIGAPDTTISGLYRTSFSAPNTIEPVVVYGGTDGALGTITHWLYDSVRHRVVYMLSRMTLPVEASNTLMIVDTETKAVQTVTSLPSSPYVTFIGFDANTVTNFFWDNPSRPQVGYLDTIRLSDGQTTRTTLFQGESSRFMSPVENSLSPSQQLFMSWDDRGLYSLTLPGLQTATNTSLGHVQNVGILWSPDSQRVLLTVRDESKPYQPSLGEVHKKQLVYDVSTGNVVDTLENGSFSFLWSPGVYAIYRYYDSTNPTTDSIRAYNPITKQSVVLQVGKKLIPDSILGMDWVAQ